MQTGRGNQIELRLLFVPECELTGRPRSRGHRGEQIEALGVPVFVTGGVGDLPEASFESYLLTGIAV